MLLAELKINRLQYCIAAHAVIRSLSYLETAQTAAYWHYYWEFYRRVLIFPGEIKRFSTSSAGSTKSDIRSHSCLLVHTMCNIEVLLNTIVHITEQSEIVVTMHPPIFVGTKL